MQEIWVPIPEFENHYQASSLGRVRSIERFVFHSSNGWVKRKSHVLKPSITQKGYNLVVLSKDSVNKTFSVHRLIAKSFLDNPLKYEQVNHKNGIKTDNCVTNLEWCSNLQNFNHSVKNGLRENSFILFKKGMRAVLITDEINKTISFPSVLKAAEYLNTSSGAVGSVLNGSRRRIKNHKAYYI